MWVENMAVTLILKTNMTLLLLVAIFKIHLIWKTLTLVSIAAPLSIWAFLEKGITLISLILINMQ